MCTVYVQYVIAHDCAIQPCRVPHSLLLQKTLPDGGHRWLWLPSRQRTKDKGQPLIRRDRGDTFYSFPEAVQGIVFVSTPLYFCLDKPTLSQFCHSLFGVPPPSRFIAIPPVPVPAPLPSRPWGSTSIM